MSSGTYDFAVPYNALGVLLKYLLLVPSSTSAVSVPPTAVLLGEVANAFASTPPSLGPPRPMIDPLKLGLEPESPDDTKTEMPSASACAHIVSMAAFEAASTLISPYP